MLENKLIKASQAILKNTVLLVCSGNGMVADCELDGENPDYEGNKIPVLRGTHGLWTHYPVMRRNLITYDDFVTEGFFKSNPARFWYVYGDIMNKHQRAMPHRGYKAIAEIIKRAEKTDKYWIYHDGVDNFYERINGIDKRRITNAKGLLSDWQCKTCDIL